MSKTNISNLNTEDELIKILKNFNTLLSSVGCGRTKSHDERFAICMLLSSLAKTQELNYPLELLHQDKPDFKLMLGAEISGIEITFARNQNQAHFKALMNRSEKQKVYSTNVFAPDKILTKNEMQKLIDHNVSGYPLMGEQPYINWAAYVSQGISKKSAAFKNDKFKKYSKNSLVVVVETPDMICIDDINKAIKYLEEVWPKDIGFDCVYVQQYDYIIKIVPNRLASVYVVNDIWGFYE